MNFTIFRHSNKQSEQFGWQANLIAKLSSSRNTNEQQVRKIVSSRFSTGK